MDLQLILRAANIIGAYAMSAVAFDILEFAQTVRDKAKLTPEQAEGISQAFSDARADIHATELHLKTNIEAIKAEYRNGCSEKH
jgi:hypothetical protein